MTAAKARKILHCIAAAIGAAIFALLLATFVLFFLLEQGWLHPIQSLQIREEICTYLEETRPGQKLRVTFPTYNPIMDDFSAFIKDGEGQILFGLSWCEEHGFTERETFQNKDGRWLMLPPGS